MQIMLEEQNYVRISGVLIHTGKDTTEKTHNFVIEDSSDLIAHIKNINKSIVLGKSRIKD